MKRYPVLKVFLFVVAFIVAFQISVSWNMISIKTTRAYADIPCSICQWTLGEVDKYIYNDPQQEDYAKTLGKVCQVLPASFQPLCAAFAREYETKLIKLSMEGYPAQAICTELNLCQNAKVKACTQECANLTNCVLDPGLCTTTENSATENLAPPSL